MSDTSTDSIVLLGASLALISEATIERSGKSAISISSQSEVFFWEANFADNTDFDIHSREGAYFEFRGDVRFNANGRRPVSIEAKAQTLRMFS